MLEENKIKLGQQVIHLDPAFLKFNDRTLNEFFEKISGRIDYIGQVLVTCQTLHRLRLDDVESTYARAFNHWKDERKSDKNAENLAKEDVEYKQAKKKERAAFDRKDKVLRHLNSLNSAREDAFNRGHMLRRELQKLGEDVIMGDIDSVLRDADSYK